MKTHLLRCSNCGGSNLRRSKRQSFAEAFRMILGIYPFRCMDCGVRREISVWLISKLNTAKCPKCLSPKLVVWPEKYFRLGGLGNMMLTFGAHRYRCHACRHNFLSFRPRQDEVEREYPEQALAE
jgi:DNA-directed RNA polymerase subunit RPC12/RpoP